MLPPPESDVWEGKIAKSGAFLPTMGARGLAPFLPRRTAAIRCAIVDLVCEDAPESSPSPGPIGTTADAGEGQEPAAEATDRGDVPGAHSEAPEEARAWRLTRLQEVLLVLIAIVSLSALLYIVVTVLST
jgi:hypothetical protein